MVVPNSYSFCDNKCVQIKPVRVLLQDILRRSQEGTTEDMVPETIVQNCDIQSHMHTHTGEKPYSCSQASNEDSESPRKELCLAPNCEELVAEKNIKLSENAKKPYTCSLCNKSFTRNYAMIIHMRTHTKEKPFTCILCSKPFSNNKNLKRHMRIHTGDKPFSCLICNKLFSQRINMKTHMRTHSGEKPFSCTYCNTSFARRNSFKEHILRHTGETYSCSHCHKSYLLKDSLRKHMLIHTRETFLK